MFEIICELARMTTRNDYLRKRTTYIKKANRLIAVRPIERPKKTRPDETISPRKPNYLHLEDSKTIFRKYDEYGKVILQAPPKHSPFDKIA